MWRGYFTNYTLTLWLWFTDLFLWIIETKLVFLKGIYLIQSKWLLSSFYKPDMKYKSLIIFSHFWLHAQNQIYKNLMICVFIFPLTSCNLKPFLFLLGEILHLLSCKIWFLHISRIFVKKMGLILPEFDFCFQLTRLLE
jgi:hypothetical protein